MPKTKMSAEKKKLLVEFLLDYRDFNKKWTPEKIGEVVGWSPQRIQYHINKRRDTA